MDFSPIYSGLDFGSVSTGIILVAAAIGGCWLAFKGAKMLVTSIKAM